MRAPIARERGEDGLRHSGGVHSAPLLKKHDHHDFGFIGGRVAHEKAVRARRVRGCGGPSFAGNFHAAHECSMRHAKRDGVLKPCEDGSVGAEARAAALTQRELPIAFQKTNRRDFNAAFTQRFELQFLLTRGDGDMSDGFVRRKAGGRIKARAAEYVHKLRGAEALRHCRDEGVAGIGDGIFRIQFRDGRGMRAIHLDRADAKLAPAKDVLVRIELSRFQKRVKYEGLERRAGAFKLLLRVCKIVRGENRAGRNVHHHQ